MKKKYKLEVESEVPLVDYSSIGLGELQEIIDDMENNPPKDKRKAEYKEYVKTLNNFFDLYNKKRGEKIYRLIKL